MKKSILLLISLFSLSSCRGANFEPVKQKINEIIEFHKNNQITKFTHERISNSSLTETYKISLEENYYYLGYSYQEKWVYYLDNYVYDVTLDKTFFSVTGKVTLSHKIQPITTSFLGYLLENNVTNYFEDIKSLSYEVFLLDILSLIDKGEVQKNYNYEFENDVFRINGSSNNELTNSTIMIEYKNNVVTTTKWNTTNLLDNTNYEFINVYTLECDIVYPDLSESKFIE